MSDASNSNPLVKALAKCKHGFIAVFLFSFAINMTSLLTSIYALQVLDRVLGSGNLYTLLFLSIIIAFVYFVNTMLTIARSFTLNKIAEWLDNNISPTIFSYSVAASATKQGTSTSQLLRDFQTVKSFITGTSFATLCDAPWTIVFIAILYVIHPYMGVVATIGLVITISFGFVNAYSTNKHLASATTNSINGMRQADIATRNAEVVEAMGMMDNVASNWFKHNNLALKYQTIASNINGAISNIARLLRSLVQMSITGVAAYIIVLTNNQAMTSGEMIASSIILGKALAPFDNSIAMWKEITSAHKAYKNIMEAFNNITLRQEAMVVSEVKGHLTLENVYYAHNSGKLPEGAQPNYILKGISFSVAPGEIVAVMGPSACGKSTLARIIVGVWKATTGSARLDGADIYKWHREHFGQNVGYVPQGIELFSGTIKQNIARMAQDSEIDIEEVEKAIEFTGADKVISNLPEGYNTDLGIMTSNISGGQRQRVAIARGFYKKPKLVVLDEPNSALDQAGEEALAQTLRKAKANGISVIVISHRPSILAVTDKVLLMQEGSVAAYGKTEEILMKMRQMTEHK